jgi:hypothetical protein
VITNPDLDNVDPPAEQEDFKQNVGQVIGGVLLWKSNVANSRLRGAFGTEWRSDAVSLQTNEKAPSG